MSWFRSQRPNVIIPLGLCLLLAAQAVTVPIMPTAQAFSAPVPVVFVPQEATMGRAAGLTETLASESTLWQRLSARGYIPGRTLFSCPPTNDHEEDYVALAARVLKPCLEDALAASGQSQVDVMAAGGAAMAVRYYAQTKDYHGEIRTAVLFSPPNHGSFLAAELAVDWFAAHLGFKVPGVINQDLFSGEPVSPPPFKTEEQYMKQRVQDFYLPLWFVYVMSEDYLAPARTAGKQTLIQWLAESRPEWVETLWHRNDNPPLGLPDRTLVPPVPGQDLSLTYYEYLAMEVAHRLYLQRTGQSRWQSPDLWRLIPDDGRVDRIELVQKLFALTKDFWTANKTQILLWAARHLLQSSQGVAWRRLAPEFLQLDRPFVANAFLHSWTDFVPATPGTPRFVVIAGTASDIWSGTNLGSGRHDWFTDLSSMLMPLGQEGVFRSFQATLQTTPWLVAGYAPAVNFAIDAFEHYYPVTREHLIRQDGEAKLSSHTIEGNSQASPWEPRYIRIRNVGQSGTSLQMAIDFGQVPEGFQPVAWVHAGPETKQGVMPNTIGIDVAPASDGKGWTGTVASVGLAENGQLLVGWRLQPKADTVPEPEASLWSPVRYRLTPEVLPLAQTENTDETAPVATLPAGPTDPPAPYPGESRDQGSARLPSAPADTSATAPQPSQESGPQAADVVVANPRNVGAQGVPLIQVVLTTRLTTDKKPDRTYHTRWEWIWGDGTVSNDDRGEVLGRQTHTYADPGHYQIEAISYSNKGTVLTRKLFAVDITKPGEEMTLEALTVQEPTVSLKLDGPEKWITGRPADFKVRAEVMPPPMATKVHVTVYPAQHFQVQWAKPGKFTVRAAAVVQVTYDVNGTTVTITDTYLATREVDVATLSLTG